MEELKCVSMEYGEQCVQMDGAFQMLLLLASSLEWEKEVSFLLEIFTMIIHLHIGPTSITDSFMFGEGNGPVVYSNVVCHGWESNIVECAKDLYGTFECPNTNIAGVICRDGEECLHEDT